MQLVKLIVYAPPEAEEAVRLALGNAGAGKIGNYDFCAFVTKGTGYFRPLKGATPYQGDEGRLETLDEYRIETLCAEKELPKVLMAMRQAHPYEEIAYDIIPLLNEKYTKYVPKRKRD